MAESVENRSNAGTAASRSNRETLHWKGREHEAAPGAMATPQVALYEDFAKRPQMLTGHRMNGVGIRSLVRSF